MTQISRLPGAPPVDGEERLRSACNEVEGLFISQLIAEMDKPAWGEGAFGGSGATRMFAAQRNMALADEMGRRSALGLADMIYGELSHSVAEGDAD